MNICAVHLVTFSPTHTSKQVGEAIVRGTGVSEIMKTDLTLHPAGKLEIPENTLAATWPARPAQRRRTVPARPAPWGRGAGRAAVCLWQPGLCKGVGGVGCICVGKRV